MAMDAGEVERLIKAKLPDAKVTIRDLVGDGDHLSARVVSQAFRGKTRVQQHQMVYEALAGRMGGVLHALALETSAPADGRSKATATSSEGVREPMSQQTDHDRIRTLVAGNDVVLFMKGTKHSPQCGFSDQVVFSVTQMGSRSWSAPVPRPDMDRCPHIDRTLVTYRIRPAQHHSGCVVLSSFQVKTAWVIATPCCWMWSLTWVFCAVEPPGSRRCRKWCGVNVGWAPWQVDLSASSACPRRRPGPAQTGDERESERQAP